jgi:hypothetical protein
MILFTFIEYCAILFTNSEYSLKVEVLIQLCRILLSTIKFLVYYFYP